MTTEELNPEEHQILFRKRGEYAVDVNFHHVHIPIHLNNIFLVADKAITIAEGYAKLISDQNIFESNKSANSIRYFEKDLKSLTSALPRSSSRISKRQLGLMFGLIGTAVV